MQMSILSVSIRASNLRYVRVWSWWSVAECSWGIRFNNDKMIDYSWGRPCNNGALA